jgi:hypothetical protein
MTSPADGIILLQNAAQTDFTRLQFGGTTSSFPSLKRNATSIEFRLADDSAGAPLIASNVTTADAGIVSFGARSVVRSGADGSIQLSNQANTSFSSLIYGGTGSGGALTSNRIQKNVVSIADNTFTDVFTVTIPNAAHSGSIEIRLTGTKGAGDAEGAAGSTSSTIYLISIQRTAGATTTVAISAASPTIATTIAAGNAVATTAQCSAMSGAVGAQQTFTIQVKIARAAGASTNHTCFAIAELANANATGITIA